MGWESLCPGAGGPARYLQLHLHQEDSVMVGEDLVYSLIVTPFINSVSCLLCQPPFWGCQSRPKLVPQEAEAAKAKGSCSHYWRRHIQHTGRLVFAFLDSITGGVFFECLRLVLLTRDWFRAQSVGEYLGGMFLHM